MKTKTINPWICQECAWHNSEEDLKCRNKTCTNTKDKQEVRV